MRKFHCVISQCVCTTGRFVSLVLKRILLMWMYGYYIHNIYLHIYQLGSHSRVTFNNIRSLRYRHSFSLSCFLFFSTLLNGLVSQSKPVLTDLTSADWFRWLWDRVSSLSRWGEQQVTQSSGCSVMCANTNTHSNILCMSLAGVLLRSYYTDTILWKEELVLTSVSQPVCCKVNWCVL